MFVISIDYLDWLSAALGSSIHRRAWGQFVSGCSCAPGLSCVLCSARDSRQSKSKCINQLSEKSKSLMLAIVSTIASHNSFCSIAVSRPFLHSSLPRGLPPFAPFTPLNIASQNIHTPASFLLSLGAHLVLGRVDLLPPAHAADALLVSTIVAVMPLRVDLHLADAAKARADPAPCLCQPRLALLGDL